MDYIYHVQWQLCMGHTAQGCDSYPVVYICKKEQCSIPQTNIALLSSVCAGSGVWKYTLY